MSVLGKLKVELKYKRLQDADFFGNIIDEKVYEFNGVCIY